MARNDNMKEMVENDGARTALADCLQAIMDVEKIRIDSLAAHWLDTSHGAETHALLNYVQFSSTITK